MQRLRGRSIEAESMFDFHMAADARMSRTNYADDQAWKVELGRKGEAALAFQTRYGGRAEIVSIAPVWTVAKGRIARHQSYRRPPEVADYGPNYTFVRAEIVENLALTARYWVMESQAAGGEYVVKNHSDRDIELQIELFGTVRVNGRKRRLNVLTLGDYSLALHLGQIGAINPVLVLEGASVEVYGGRISSAKLGRKLVLPAGEEARVPFVTAGMEDMRDSLSVAAHWLARPWDVYFEEIEGRAGAAPKIETGSKNWDALIDLSYTVLRQTPMGTSDCLPHDSFVANRGGHRGWSRRGDGADHIRGWAGQDPTLAYLCATAFATIDSDFAKGIIRNYLATQDESGFIDRRPGLAGQRQGLMLPPILSRLTWQVYQQCEDRDFLAEVWDGLCAFFERWMAEDSDGDGAPEWQSERQMGYVAFPTFGRGQGWAQGADVRQMETPDLLATMISEAEALRAIAEDLEKDEEVKDFRKKSLQLLERLEEFWDGGRYTYRDRDTHLSSESIELLRGGAGDEIHVVERRLSPPDRVMLRVVGGLSQAPRIRMRLTGKDEAGQDCLIEEDVDAFDWHHHQGIYTTERPLSHVGEIEIQGLSRVYKVDVKTIDSSRLDINHLLPLWTGCLPKERAASLVKMAMDEASFLCANGLTMVSRNDPNFDASNARGGGGIWMYWLSLIGEGMVKSGFHDEAADLLKRVMDGLCKVLEREGHLSQFYHAEAVKGLGERQHIGGIVPLNLLSDVIGLRILSPFKVMVGGPFAWGQSITVEQHGVIAGRGADGIWIHFPSGHKVALAADAEWQTVVDASDVESPAEPTALPEPPELDVFSGEDKQRIDIEIDSAKDKPQADDSAMPDADES